MSFQYTSQPTGDDLFAGGGEMGALMRSIDWAKTPLGPVAEWSQTLRTMVGMLLRNEFPMLLWWGSQHIQLYNDAYRPIPGDKHPKSMGQPAIECWTEIWDIIEPMIAAPFAGKAATSSDDLFLLINRKGFLEETHFKVAYSPVPDETVESTGIGGVLATVAETTQQVYGERQLRTLRELAVKAAEAKTPEQACETAAATLADNQYDVPFALFYLLNPDGTEARLAASCGFEIISTTDLSVIDLQAHDSTEVTWSLANVVQTNQLEIFSDLTNRMGPLPTGRWSASPHTAIALPLTVPDQPRAYGVLVAGISPHRVFDEGYRTFYELAAGQVTTAIRNALAYQQERKRAEALAEIDRAKTAFFSNVSHEFRTPLTLMLAPLEDALTDPTGSLSGEQLHLVHRNCLRLLKLVNTLLDFSRLEAGRIQAVYEPTDLGAFTAELASQFRSAIERAGLQLQIECPPLSEPIYIDREMWEKIVLNLLSNALKFTFEGAITVTLQQRGGSAELNIYDTGTGIAAEELSHIFERFHRVPNARSRTHEGTGIGLALVRELVQLHGGTVDVTSEVGKGSCFTITIPTGIGHLPPDRIGSDRTLTSTATQVAAYVEESLRWSGLTPDQEMAREWDTISALTNTIGDRSTRILVVDDNADMLNYVTRLLSQYYIVESVPDGLSALEAVRQRLPNLVLTDVMMPGLDGFQLLQALRDDPRTEPIPVIMLSARAGEEARVDGLAAGADDYLIKPFSARELLARVRANLRLAHLYQVIRHREADLQTANKEIAQFAFIIAHDLRNPLVNIGGFVGEIRYAIDALVTSFRSLLPYLDETQRKTVLQSVEIDIPESLTIINQAITRMDRLITAVLNYARAGRRQFDFQTIDMTALVNEILIGLSHQLKQRNVRVTIGKLPTIHSDPVAMGQIMDNLLTNAVLYLDPSRPGEVEISAEIAEQSVTFHVRDNGRGIAEEDSSKIYEPFRRAGKEDRPGEGMGLANVQMLVRRLGGRVWFTSTLGIGTTFSFTISQTDSLPVSNARTAVKSQPQ